MMMDLRGKKTLRGLDFVFSTSLPFLLLYNFLELRGYQAYPKRRFEHSTL